MAFCMTLFCISLIFLVLKDFADFPYTRAFVVHLYFYAIHKLLVQSLLQTVTIMWNVFRGCFADFIVHYVYGKLLNSSPYEGPLSLFLYSLPVNNTAAPVSRWSRSVVQISVTVKSHAVINSFGQFHGCQKWYYTRLLLPTRQQFQVSDGIAALIKVNNYLPHVTGFGLNFVTKIALLHLVDVTFRVLCATCTRSDHTRCRPQRWPRRQWPSSATSCCCCGCSRTELWLALNERATVGCIRGHSTTHDAYACGISRGN